LRLYRPLYFLLLSAISLIAQEERFTHLTVNEGLSQNSVTCILQDYQGFIWIGTYGGLNRYDGNKIKQYVKDVNDFTTLATNAVKFIFEDSKKNLWIGCYGGGLCKFIRDKEEFIHFPNNLDSLNVGNYENVLTISEDATGLLWIGSEGGLSLFSPATGKYLKHYYKFIQNADNVNVREVFSSYVDQQNNLWLGIRQQFGIFNKKTGKLKNVINIPLFDSYRIARDENGKFWLSSFNNGIIEYDPATGTQNHYTTKINKGISLCSNNTESIFVDNKNQIWVGTRGEGITIIDQKNKKTRYLKYDSGSVYSIGNNYIFCFYLDRSGVFWIGTQLGLSMIDQNRKKFNSIPLTKTLRNSSSDILVSSIAKDHNGNFWFGTWGNGVFEYEFKTKKITQFKNIPGNNNSISFNVIRSLCIDKNNDLWIGTDGELDILNLNTKQIFKFSENTPDSFIPDNIYNHIYEDRKGNIWIGAWHGGLLKCSFSHQNHRLSYRQFIPDPSDSESLSHKTVTRIFQDRKGAFWIATKGGGINEVIGINKTKNTLRFKHYRNIRGDNSSLASDEVMNIVEDKNENLWFGTNTGGLSCLNKSNGRFKNFTVKDGLISNTIAGILEDNRSNLWISTFKGLSRFNTATNQIQNFDENDGMLCQYFIENSAFKDNNGEMFFGGENGVVHFLPDSIINNNTVPQIKITDLQIFNKSVKIGEKISGNVILTKAITETQQVKLTYNESVITIGFAALHYSSVKKNKFAYRLTGFDNDWRYTDAGRQFDTYTNLNPGEYLFEVKATNNDGVWSTNEATLKIIITPPFWSTWWAYLFYVSLAAALVYLYIHIKTNTQENELRTLRKADKIKSEFLAQMSHEIRTPLNAIVANVDFLNDSFGEKMDPDTRESFDSIGLASERIIRTIDLILNIAELQTGAYELQFEKVDLDANILKKLYQEYQLSAKQKELEFVYICNVENAILDADEYSITQIFANLIDNAIKFTKKGTVEIILGRNDANNIIVEIKDTGVGIAKEFMPKLFEPFVQEEQGYSRSYDGNGLGLALVKRYCELNNSIIEITSEKNVGSTFRIIFNSPETDQSAEGSIDI
jgi:signal transduction histidine kinase/ligand-binding sensor domain-containing protein